MWIYCIPHTDMIPSMKTSSLILGIASFCVNTSVMSPKTMKRIGKIAPVIIANTLWTLISPKVIISIQDTKNTKSYHLNNIFFVELTYLRGNQADLITCSPMHTSYWRKHRKNCECCPVSQLIVRSQRLSWFQVLNCQNCSQCLKCHKSLGLLLGGALKMS